MPLRYGIYILIACLLTPGCEPQGERDEAPQNDTEEMHGIEGGEATDMSVYNLESTWTTSENRQIKLTDLGGKVQVVAMVYTTCEFACPRILSDMKRIEQQIENIENNDQVNFVIVTIDPEVDTPEKLAKYAEESKLDKGRWTLLHGDKGDILELAALLGVRFKKTTDKDYAHSNIITVLDEEGVIAHQQEGLGTKPTQTLEAIETLIDN